MGNLIKRLGLLVWSLRYSWKTAVPAALVTGVAGAAVLWWATSINDLPFTFLVIGAGAATLSLAFTFVEPSIAGRARAWSKVSEELWWGPWAGIALVVVGVGLMGLGLALAEWVVAAMTLIVLGTLPALVGAIYIDTQVDGMGSMAPVPRLLTVLGLAAVVTGGATAGFSEVAGERMVGAALGVIGLVTFKIGLPDALNLRKRSSGGIAIENRIDPLVLLVVAFVALVGATLLLILPNDQPALLLVGGVVLLIGLTVLAEAALRWRLALQHQRSIWRWLFLSGVAVGALVLGGWGGWQLFQDLGEWRRMVLAVVAGVFLLGAYFILRWEGVYFLVLLSFVSIWVLYPRDRAEPDVTGVDLAVGSQPIVLALGDSFMAGQGAPLFHKNTNSKGVVGQSSCRRSPNAFVEVMADELDRVEFEDRDRRVVLNWACSGAVISDIGDGAQLDEAYHGDGSPISARSQLENLQDLRAEAKQRIEVVLLTVGGNDARFADVVAACLLPADCDEISDQWLQGAVELQPGLQALYEMVRETLDNEGVDAPLVIVPYPQVLALDRPAGCRLAFSDDERAFALDFERELNSRILHAAHEAQVVVFPGAFGAFRGTDDREAHLLCDERPGMNFLHLMPHEGPIGALLNPSNWKDGTMHPRQEGHERTGKILAEWLTANLDTAGTYADFEYQRGDFADLCRTLPDGLPIVGGTDASSSSGEGLTGTARCPDPTENPDDDEDEAMRLTEDEWFKRQLTGTADEVSLPLAAVLTAGMLFALSLYALLHPRYRRNSLYVAVFPGGHVGESDE